MKKFGMKRGSEDISLNITAMADIFTVILVFLLKSYATGAMTIQPTAQLELPSAQMQSQHVEAIKLEISKENLVLEGEKIVSLSNYEFPQKDLSSMGFSKTLFESLQKIRARQDASRDNIIIIADKHVPYKSLKVILGSAAGNGLTNFKMAVRSLE